MPIEFLPDKPQRVPGIRCAAIAATIKVPNRLDFVLFDLGENTQSSCVTTTNALAAAPVQLVRRHLKKAQPRYWLINTGYANAAMGAAGLEAALTICQELAQHVDCKVEQILPFSTGVIGEPLPVAKMVKALPALTSSLSDDAWQDAAKGIVTTDTQYKIVSKTFVWQEQAFIMQGIAKGAGMIKPNMATMLAFVATDLKISQPDVDAMLKAAVAKSFNAISVDGDTSTNDCIAFAATGQNDLVVSRNSDLGTFVQECLDEVCLELALQIIKDGEGATKVIEIQVSGAKSIADAKAVAESVGHSPLVKTACFASDPNWGRILMAIGKAPGVTVNPDQLSVQLGGELLFHNGGRVPNYDETVFAQKMQGEHISIQVDLHQGQESFTYWTNDLSYEYVKINADYRS